jgi:hypothetical protein
LTVGLDTCCFVLHLSLTVELDTWCCFPSHICSGWYSNLFFDTGLSITEEAQYRESNLVY